MRPRLRVILCHAILLRYVQALVIERVSRTLSPAATRCKAIIPWLMGSMPEFKPPPPGLPSQHDLAAEGPALDPGQVCSSVNGVKLCVHGGLTLFRGERASSLHAAWVPIECREATYVDRVLRDFFATYASLPAGRVAPVADPQEVPCKACPSSMFC